MISSNSKGGSIDEFEKFSYIGVSPIPQLIYTNLAQNYPISLGSQAWIRIPFKIIVFIEN